MPNTNLKMIPDWLNVCEVTTTGVLSVVMMINTVLCGICEEGFPEHVKKVDGKKDLELKVPKTAISDMRIMLHIMGLM